MNEADAINEIRECAQEGKYERIREICLDLKPMIRFRVAIKLDILPITQEAITNFSAMPVEKQADEFVTWATNANREGTKATSRELLRHATNWLHRMGASELADAWLAADFTKMITAASKLDALVQTKLAIQLAIIPNEANAIALFAEYSASRRGVAIAEMLWQKYGTAERPVEKDERGVPTLFSGEEKLWITVEFRKQTEAFLEHLTLNNLSAMRYATLRLRAILDSTEMLIEGRSKLHRAVVQEKKED